MRMEAHDNDDYPVGTHEDSIRLWEDQDTLTQVEMTLQSACTSYTHSISLSNSWRGGELTSAEKLSSSTTLT